MHINWFPGHMHRTNKLLLENIKKVDICIEILDSRIPLSSRNPIVEEIIYEKPTLILLNKVDLADPELTAQWQKLLEVDGRKVMCISANDPKTKQKIIAAAKELFNKELKEGRRGIRALVTGIPNVGKSTLINTLVGKQKAKTGNRPAVTKDLQRIFIEEGFDLYDTPGILWHKFEDQSVGVKLGITGSIRDEVLIITEIALSALEYMKTFYPEALLKRYNLTEIPEFDYDQTVLLETIARKRGCIGKGGSIDWDKTSNLILREMRDGKIGPFTLDRINEKLPSQVD